jgi:cobalt-zinc-cadmium efflux system outer membrane protein
MLCNPQKMLLVLGALAVALTGGCKTGRDRGPPPPFNPPYSWTPAGGSRQGPVASNQLPAAGGQQHDAGKSGVRLASAVEPLPPAEADSTPWSPSSSPAPAEIVPAPMQALAAPPPLSLFQAIEVGLAQNPDLIALRYAQDVSEGALGVAETYPFNPWVQIQVTPYQRSADPLINAAPVNHYVLVMQQLQLAHQRQHRTDAAAAALNSVRWNYVMAQLNNIAQTQRLYFTALYLRGIAELEAQQADLNQQLLSISQKQFEGGTITGADLAIVRLDQSTARQQARLALTNYETALLDLKRQLGIPPVMPLQLGGRLADFRFHNVAGSSSLWTEHIALELPVGADQTSIAHALACGRPDVLAAASDVETARANLDLARASRVPDLQIGPYYQRNNDPVTYWGFRAQMDIPVLNTGVPLVRQRLAEVNQRQGTYEQLLNRATLEAQAAIERYERSLTLADDSQPLVGEELPIELQRLEQQFLAGEIDLVRVVTARTSFFQARRAALDTLNEVAQASANLLAATALPPETLVTPDPGSVK